METKKYSNAISILRKIDEDQRNWQSGLMRIGELLAAAESAEKELTGAQTALETTRAEIAASTLEKQNLERSNRTARAEFEAADTKRNAKRSEIASEGAELDRQIEAKRTKLAEIEAAIEEQRRKFL